MTANSRCNGACPCGDTKAKAPKAKGITKRFARVLLACWASLPVGAIATIVTGDLRPLGVGLVLFLSATGWGFLALEADKKAAQ